MPSLAGPGTLCCGRCSTWLSRIPASPSWSAQPHGVLVTWAVMMHGGFIIDTEGARFADDSQGGRAQEKVPLFRTRKRRRADGSSYPWIAAETGVVNQYYCYCVDEDFGPFVLTSCSCFPFNAKPCLNGNERAKRQAARAGIGFEPLDNGFAAAGDVPALQAICRSPGPAQIDALLRKWLAILPHPFSPAGRAAGYRHDISILQAEFSLTQMLDQPAAGRVFFEHAIRDNLDLGRPDRISLIFARSICRGRKNRTPGVFATRVVTDGVTPSLRDKHAQIKQYHKHGDGTRIAGLQLTDPRAQALLHILLMFRLHTAGLASKDLRELLAESLGRPAGAITASQATCDLRRLRAHGLTEQIPRTHRYQVTPAGLTTAISPPASTTQSRRPEWPHSAPPLPPHCAGPTGPTRQPSRISPARQRSRSRPDKNLPQDHQT